MSRIFINLKRFDVPRALGGICPHENPEQWIRWVIKETISHGLGRLEGMELVYLLPEGLLIPARDELESHPAPESGNIAIGCQGVFRENISAGGNFGAFTTNLPASAAVNLGASWTIIGHSEERKDKLGILAAYDPDIGGSAQALGRATETVNRLINQEALRAFDSGLNVLLCIGETAEQRGEGSFKEQQPRIQTALHSQVEIGVGGVAAYLAKQKLAIGYEPIWAIGPGKTPPGAQYIGFVSDYIKKSCKAIHGFVPPVVYGGGLKEANVEEIAGVETIDGGLVALTKFTQPIGFDPNDLRIIVERYMKRKGTG
ncbi:MAG: triosephosphate isomerase [Spirochaetaceae bacterium]|nr:MAG: triosephosphate isomerase [Spirochaetaceae bacterium]